jgi:hypothetical protein
MHLALLIDPPVRRLGQDETGTQQSQQQRKRLH